MKYAIPFLFLLAALTGGFNSSAQESFRTEHDLLGDMKIPSDAYYGVQAARAMENFNISKFTVSDFPEFINALALVKLAAAKSNMDAGGLESDKVDAIEEACNAIMEGKYHDQFAIDMYQGGAGTSTNMCANEVIANVALEMMGEPLGSYDIIEPHDDLNMSQSTNDFYPTALKVAMVLKNQKVIDELHALADAFDKKGNEFDEILKMGRTEMQDAVPMTLGQEFHAFADALRGEVAFLEQAEEYLHSHNMGGTASGTGLNAQDGITAGCSKHLSDLTGKEFTAADNLIAATSDMQSFVVYSSALRSLAAKLSKTASDLILLSSGPRTGLFEINLPALQPGSSIMPGKVNPVIPELTNIVAFRVMGNDVTVGLAGKTGQLQLNAYEPLIAVCVFESQMLLTNMMNTLRTKCVDGITANEDILANYINRSVGIVTALNPVLGYDKATELAKEALASGKGILELVREQNLLTEKQIEEILDPKAMTGQK